MHIAIIPDGNRRWAKDRNLSIKEGYKKGQEVVRDIVKEAMKIGLDHLSIFILSTENANRAPEWIDLFSTLLQKYLKPMALEAIEEGCKISFLGNKDILGANIGNLLRAIELKKPNKEKMQLHFCFGYSGRADLINATGAMIEAKADPKDLRKYLSTAGIPDPDIIIRTSGERRISNFLLFESAYSELFFTNKHWPDFTAEQFRNIIQDFEGRERRFGK